MKFPWMKGKLWRVLCVLKFRFCEGDWREFLRLECGVGAAGNEGKMGRKI